MMPLYLFCPLQGIKAHKTKSLWDLCLFFNLQGVISAEIYSVETPTFQSKAAYCMSSEDDYTKKSLINSSEIESCRPGNKDHGEKVVLPNTQK